MIAKLPSAPWLVGFAVVAVAAAARTQAGQERVVQVAVTGGSDRSVYLDHGRDVGLRVGAVVRLFPPGGAPIEVEIRSLSQTSARAELQPGMPLPPIGTPGEARVAAAEPVATPAGGGQQPAVPAHPPWTRQEPGRPDDQPLLVPTFRQRPEDRPATLDGRLFLMSQWSRDDGAARSSDYLLTRVGLRGEATNWLGQAERVKFAGEVDDRRISVPDRPDESDQTGRIDLLSVQFGTEAWSPIGCEVGRFFSCGLPELGLVDGAELVFRFQGGIRLGGGIASYPRPFPARDTGEDKGVHAFVDYTADSRRSFAATFGVQKTWHQGAPDRDLMLFRVEGRPTDQISLYGTAKVDLYTGSDTIKGSGPDLTEAFGMARWDGSAVGTGITLSRFTWPELKRQEYQNLPVELVRDGAVDRVSWNGFWRPTTALRLGLRADAYRDQDLSGTSYGIDGDLQDPIGAGSFLTLSVFESDGGATSGPGARVALRAPVAAGSWRVGYRYYRYDVQGLVTGAESYTRQSAEIGLSLPIAASGDLDASLERWFGDAEDAWSFGLYVQWRF